MCRFIGRNFKIQCVTVDAVLCNTCSCSLIFRYKKQLNNYVCFMGKVLLEDVEYNLGRYFVFWHIATIPSSSQF